MPLFFWAKVKLISSMFFIINKVISMGGLLYD